MFRVVMGERVVAEHLTAAQAHILIGDIPERPVVPGGLRAIKQRGARDKQRRTD